MATSKLSPQERAAYFNQMTRRNGQNLSAISGAESGYYSISVPKARLLAGLDLMISATLTATHASNTSYTAHEDAPFNFLSRVELQANNGFAPFSITGQALADYNKTLYGAANINPAVTGRGRVVQGLTSSSGGTANVVRFTLSLPNMLNERDPVGLILMQADDVIVNLNITLGTVANLAPASGGYTFALSNITIALLTDTYTVPADQANAMPDMSVLKLVQERVFTLIAGENILQLSTQRIYRKIGFIVYSTAPARQPDSIITSNIELIFNQADIPYRYSPLQLAAINAGQYNGALQNGSYVFDFSDNGIPNYGSSRDYVDSSQLTEAWIKFTTSAAGTCRVWTESLIHMD